MPFTSPISTLQASQLSAAEIAALTTYEITQYLTTADMGVLTADQVKLLTTAQVAVLSPAQVAALNGGPVLGVVLAIKGLSDAAIGALTTAQIPTISSDEINALTFTQMSALAASGKLGYLTTAQFGGLSLDRFNDLLAPYNASDLQTVNIAALAALGAPQVSALQTGLFAESGNLTTAALAYLSANGNFTAKMSGTQIASLTTSQLVSLNTLDVSRLTSLQVNALTAVQVAALTTAEFAALSAEQIAGITSNVISSLSTRNVSILTSVQLPGLTALQINALTTQQVAAIPVSAITPGAFTSAQLSGFSVTQVSALTTTDVDVFSTAQVGFLTQAQVQALSTADIVILNSPQINVIQNYLDIVQVRSIVTAEVIGFPPGDNVLYNYTTAQVQSLTTAQIAALPFAQIAKLTSQNMMNLNPWTTLQISSLATSQVAFINTVEFKNLPSSQISAFTTADVAQFSVAQFAPMLANIVGLKDGSGNQVQALTPAVISSINSAQLPIFTTAQIASFTTGQIAALPTSSVVMNQLTSAQEAALGTAQIAAITPLTFNALTSAQMNLLSSVQVPALTSSVIYNITSTNVAALSSKIVPYITSSQFSAMSQTQVSSITSPNLSTAELAAPGLSSVQLSFLTSAQVYALSTTQVQAITDVSRLNNVLLSALNVSAGANSFPLTTGQITNVTTANVASLTTAEVNAFSSVQIPVLSTSQIAALSPSQVAAIPYNPITLTSDQIYNFPSANFGALTSDQLRYFTSVQVPALNISKITTYQIPHVPAYFTTAQMMLLSRDQISVFTTAQVSSLSSGQILALSREQMYSFTEAQVKSFTTAQISSLTSGSANNKFAELPDSQYALLNSIDTSSVYPNLYSVPESDNQKISRTAYASVLSADLASFRPSGVNAGKLRMLPINLKVQYIVKYGTSDLTNIVSQLSYEEQRVLSLVSGLQTLPTLSGYDFNNMIYPALFPVVNPAAFTTASTAQIAGLSTAQINLLTVAQFGYLSPAQLNLLSTAQIAAISPQDIAVMTPSQASVLRTDDFAALTTAQENAMTTTLIAALTSVQLRGLTTSQVNAFSYSQAVAFNTTQLTAEQIAALVALPTLTGTSSSDGPTVSGLNGVAIKSIIEAGGAQLGFLQNVISYVAPSALASLSATNFATLVGVKTITATGGPGSPALNVFEANKLAPGMKLIINNNEYVIDVVSPDTKTITLSTPLLSAVSGSISIAPYLMELLPPQVAVMTPAHIGSLVKAHILALPGVIGSTPKLSPQSFITSLPAPAFAGFTTANFPDALYTSVAQSNYLVNSVKALLRTSTVSTWSTLDIPSFNGLNYLNNTTLLTGFSAIQIGAMTAAQLSTISPENKTILMYVFDNVIAPINIALPSFNTDLTAAKIDSAKSTTAVLGAWDAVVSVNMDLSDARNVFKFAYGSDGKIRLYVNKSFFSITYAYTSSGSINVDHTDPSYFGGQPHKFTYPTMQWDGPVVESDVAQLTTTKSTPMTWDFIHYVAQQVYNNWAAFSLFDNLSGLTGVEPTLRSAINTSVNQKVNKILEEFDITNPVTDGDFARYQQIADAQGVYYHVLDTYTEGVEMIDIASVIFDTLFKQQPERFMPLTSTQENVVMSMPLYVNDTFNFLIKITPSADQRQLDVANNNNYTPNTNQIPARTYKVRIVMN